MTTQAQSALIVHSISPGASIQDAGRPHLRNMGISRGGAMDWLALCEGAALLDHPAPLNALEMSGAGGTFEASCDTVIALSGAPMVAQLDGVTLAWNASHLLRAGARLYLGKSLGGSFSYLSVRGGFAEPMTLGAQSAHFAAGLGRHIRAGDRLTIAPQENTASIARIAGRGLRVSDRFQGGVCRIVESFQSDMFSPQTRARFCDTVFRRNPRANRMGARLDFDGARFEHNCEHSIVSDVVRGGDIQIAGDGTPYALLAESQTTGGYPRIGTVIPSDLPKLVQTPANGSIRFQFVDLETALLAESASRAQVKKLRASCHPIVRSPHDIADLLAYQLISGVTAGRELEEDDE